MRVFLLAFAIFLAMFVFPTAAADRCENPPGGDPVAQVCHESYTYYGELHYKEPYVTGCLVQIGTTCVPTGAGVNDGNTFSNYRASSVVIHAESDPLCDAGVQVCGVSIDTGRIYDLL